MKTRLSMIMSQARDMIFSNSRNYGVRQYDVDQVENSLIVVSYKAGSNKYRLYMKVILKIENGIIKEVARGDSWLEAREAYFAAIAS